MQNLVFMGSHLGYPLDAAPLGGGAVIGTRLVRSWSERPEIRLQVLGSGPKPPAPGIDYHCLAARSLPRELTSLSEFEYARFARRFEKESTRWVLERKDSLPPENTVVIANDISEGPSFTTLSREGYRIVSLWHVGVVDYFAKFYLRGWMAPERMAGIYEGVFRLGAARFLPDILKLVFDKEREAVLHSAKLVVPSRSVGERLKTSYGSVAGGGLDERIQIMPWGVWDEDSSWTAEMDGDLERLRKHYKIGPESSVLMTLSRISPEKGLHILLKAMKILEREWKGDLCLILCGLPAFMRGVAYWREVRREAEKLERARVLFPGYVSGREKELHFRLAHLFVSPSTHETYGLNTLEAMRAGLPVLTASHYGSRDWFDESFGRMVDYADLSAAPRAMAAALGDLLSDKAALARMGSSARERARAMSFAESSRRLLDSVVGLRAPAHGR